MTVRYRTRLTVSLARYGPGCFTAAGACVCLNRFRRCWTVLQAVQHLLIELVRPPLPGYASVQEPSCGRLTPACPHGGGRAHPSFPPAAVLCAHKNGPRLRRCAAGALHCRKSANAAFPRGMQSVARRICPTEADKSHTCGKCFRHAHVAAENQFDLFRACGRELCEAPLTSSTRRTHGARCPRWSGALNRWDKQAGGHRGRPCLQSVVRRGS